MATTTVDIESLKHELKAWERKFKQEHRTDKISKEDMKAHPDIGQCYGYAFGVSSSLYSAS